MWDSGYIRAFSQMSTRQISIFNIHTGGVVAKIGLGIHGFHSESEYSPKSPIIGGGAGMIAVVNYSRSDRNSNDSNFRNKCSDLEVYNTRGEKVGGITQSEMSIGESDSWYYQGFSPWDISVSTHHVMVTENKNHRSAYFGSDWDEDGMRVHFFKIKIKRDDSGIPISVEYISRASTHIVPDHLESGLHWRWLEQNSQRSSIAL